MRDILTTVSSIIVILFCLSLLFVSEEIETDQQYKEEITNQNASYQNSQPPDNKSIVFNRVQSVELEHGILKFATFENEKFKQHFFKIRDKNVIFTRETDSGMPLHSIKFVDSGCNTLLVTIPPSFEVDIMKDLISN